VPRDIANARSNHPKKKAKKIPHVFSNHDMFVFKNGVTRKEATPNAEADPSKRAELTMKLHAFSWM
tara:strand:+ start:155 stop:352 length:198 start_codon:yes stop_codon:yes gene_type:complete